MPKVKVIKRYSDVVTKKIHEKGFTFEADEKRALHLVKEGVAEIVENKANDEKPENGTTRKDK